MKAPCPDCGAPTDQVPGMNILFRCDPCEAIANAAQDSRIIEEKKHKREVFWKGICPEAFRETNPKHPGLSQVGLDAARSWLQLPTTDKRGLGFIGWTGLGKTRILYLALRACLDRGQKVMAIGSTEHARCAIRAAGGAGADTRTQDSSRQTIELCKRADVCLVDDLGKGTATPRSIEAMEELIDYRTSHNKAILWSANAGGDWLAAYFGADSGPPIVRRLSECSITPDLPRQ
tara:strand:+ start:10469 stop:11167 length:699 start_codon:yes stop_codon:yes gene_type:complete